MVKRPFFKAKIIYLDFFLPFWGTPTVLVPLPPSHCNPPSPSLVSNLICILVNRVSLPSFILLLLLMIAGVVATVQRCYSCGDHPHHSVPCQEGVVGEVVVCHDIINNKGCLTQILAGGKMYYTRDLTRLCYGLNWADLEKVVGGASGTCGQFVNSSTIF